MRCVQASLDEVLAFGLSDKGLELGGGEGVNETGFRYNEEEDLRSGECRKLIRLLHYTGLTLREGDMSSGLVLDEFNLDFTSPGLLVGFRLFIVVVVVGATLAGICICDEGIIPNGLRSIGVDVETLSLVGG